MEHQRIALAAAVLGSLVVGTSTGARAHIVMEGDILARDNDGYGNAQKMAPCDGPRANGKTYTFQPGTTITLKISETIPHPSYFRIAFDSDGEDAFADPVSIDPIDPNRAGAGQKCLKMADGSPNPDDRCGTADYCSFTSTSGGPAVLWDKLDPHTSGSGAGYTWNVKLPDVECENCTLQVIQVMEDTVHGAYCPSDSCANSASSLEDVYHRCINITLKAGATNSPGVTTAPVSNKGLECAAPALDADGGVAAADGGLSPGATTDSGCSLRTGPGASAKPWVFLLGLGALFAARRTRRRAR